MKIGAPREVYDGEKRVSMTPGSAGLLHKLRYAEDQLSASLIER
jgi:alanine dehydrogenase